MYSFSHVKELQFVYVSLHKQLQLKLMTSVEREYPKGSDGTFCQKNRDGVRGDKKDTGDKVPIGTMHSVNASHSSKPHSPTPVFIKECSIFPKLLEMRGWWRGGWGG